MFGFGKNKTQRNASGPSQSQMQPAVDDMALGYLDVINDFAQINGTMLNRFSYKRGWIDPSKTCIFIYSSLEEMVPEEAAILEEAFSIMGRGQSIVKVSQSGPNEITFSVRLL